MKTKHTLTPWKIKVQNAKNTIRLVFTDGKNRSIVAELHDLLVCKEHSDYIANAQHIVKCVNMHDALLTLLHDALLELTDDDDEQSELVFRIKDAIEKASK